MSNYSGYQQYNRTDFFIESSTLHDDHYLTCHDIYNNSRAESSESCAVAKSHQCAGGFPLNIKNDNRFILW